MSNAPKETETSADDAMSIIYGDDRSQWPAADAEDPQPSDPRSADPWWTDRRYTR